MVSTLFGMVAYRIPNSNKAYLPTAGRQAGPTLNEARLKDRASISGTPHF